jgi:hypothetical protein
MFAIKLPRLTIAGIHPSSIAENFTFIDNTGPLCRCNIVLAQILAPAVATLLSTDLTIDSFHVEVDDPDDFSSFISLLAHGTAGVSVEHLPSLLNISQKLGSRELHEKLVHFHELPAEFTPLNIVAELQFFEQARSIPQALLEYASQHFTEISHLLHSQLKIETLNVIFAMPLVLHSEDLFFDFMKAEIEGRSEDCLDLTSHIDLECVLGQKAAKFLGLVGSTGVIPVIWKRICEQLQSRDSHPIQRSATHQYSPLSQPGQGYFDGVLARLKRETHKNCATNGIIVATASHAHCGTLSILFDASDFGHNSYWHHGYVKDGYFKVDFKDRRLVMTHYAIHNSVYWEREHDFLKSWTVEGPNSGSDDWTVIDRRTNDETLHGKDKVQAVFACNGDTRHTFQFIRLYQRRQSHDSSNCHCWISQFEVLGTRMSLKT